MKNVYSIRLVFVICTSLIFSTLSFGGKENPTNPKNTKVRLTVNTPSGAPTPTVVSPVSACINGEIPQLRASGINLKWYDVDPAYGWATVLATGPTFTPSQAQLDMSTRGTTDFFVTASNGGVESPAAKVTVEIVNSSPAPTGARFYQININDSAPQLNALGTNVTWYDSNPDTGDATIIAIGTNFVPDDSQLDTAVAGNTSFFVTQDIGCEESPAKEILVQVISDSTPQYFKEITSSGIESDLLDSRSISWADYDNDGDDDALVGHVRDGIRLYQNQGDLTFTNVTGQSIPLLAGTVYSSTWGDYDNDGNIDLFVTNNDLSSQNVVYKNNGSGTMTRVSAGSASSLSTYSQASAWTDYDNDGNLDLAVANWHFLFPDRSNNLYKGNGQGSFIDVGDTDFTADLKAASNSMAWSDIDNDGDLDVFIGTVASQKDLLYINNGDGSFTKDDFRGITNVIGSTLGASFADYDNDGDQDLFLVDGYYELYNNDGSGYFTKVDIDFNVERAEVAAWGDYDLDGDLDLFLASGGGSFANSLHVNNGDGTFNSITDIVTLETNNSRNVSWSDMDNDGDLDLFVTNIGVNKLYENTVLNNNWLKIKLEGTASNRSGIGSKVHVKTAAGWQMREVISQEASSLVAHFGLADASSIEEIRVEWPSGTVDQLRNIDANQFLEITEGDYPDVPGEIEVSLNSIYLILERESELPAFFSISNVGSGSLDYSIVEIPAFSNSLSQDAGSLSPDSTDEILINLSSIDLEPGIYSAPIVISSNDPVNPTVSIEVTIEIQEMIFDIQLESTCSDNPEALLGWNIINPNSFPLEVSWQVLDTDQSGDLILEPGINILSTDTNPGVPNVLSVTWLDGLSVLREATLVSEENPCRVRGLILNAVCSDDPTVERRWEIVNRNAFTVPLEFNIIGSRDFESFEALPGNSYFFTEAQEGEQYVKIIWIDEEGKPRRQKKLSSDVVCIPDDLTVQNDPSQAEINAEVMVESDSNFTDLKAFPNPFQDKISLTMKVDREAEGEFTIRLHNLQGALVYEEVINTSFGSPDAIIDVSHLSNGTYILTTVSLRNLSRTNNLLIKK